MAEGCVFCKIIKGEIPGKKIYEDEHVFVIEDIKPAAPIHFLFLTKKHYSSLVDMKLDEGNKAGEEHLQYLFAALARVAKQKGIESFKTTINTGAQAGQTVFHLHVHMLAGGKLKSHLSPI